MIYKDINDVIKHLTDLEKKQIPYALRLTVNDLAFDVMESARKYVDSKFNGINLSKSIRVKKATKKKPYAEVYVDDYIRWKENALTTLGLGGDRSRKSMEIAMKKAGLLRAMEVLIPDGKVKAWVYVQLMSVLHLNWKAGYSANQTKASKKRKDTALRNANAAESKFFIVTSNKVAISRNLGKVIKKRSGLAPGIYARMSNNLDRKQVFRLFKIANKPNYKKQWDLEDIVKKVSDRRLNKHFDKAMKFAISTIK